MSSTPINRLNWVTFSTLFKYSRGEWISWKTSLMADRHMTNSVMKLNIRVQSGIGHNSLLVKVKFAFSRASGQRMYTDRMLVVRNRTNVA